MLVPFYETADDPRAYRREQAQADYARTLVELLVHATGAYFPRRERVVDHDRERERQLVHFAELAREGLRAWPTRWKPSALLLRALERRGLTWADVEARL